MPSGLFTKRKLNNNYTFQRDEIIPLEHINTNYKTFNFISKRFGLKKILYFFSPYKFTSIKFYKDFIKNILNYFTNKNCDFKKKLNQQKLLIYPSFGVYISYYFSFFKKLKPLNFCNFFEIKIYFFISLSSSEELIFYYLYQVIFTNCKMFSINNGSYFNAKTLAYIFSV